MKSQIKTKKDSNTTHTIERPKSGTLTPPSANEGVGQEESLTHCLCECKMVQLL